MGMGQKLGEDPGLPRPEVRQPLLILSSGMALPRSHAVKISVEFVKVFFKEVFQILVSRQSASFEQVFVLL